MKRILFCGVVFLLFSTLSKAELKTSIQAGDWESASTWSPSGVPVAGDDVVINHIVDAISLGIVDVNSIHIENNSSLDAYLNLEGNSNFTTEFNLTVASANFNSVAGITLNDGAALSVKGNAYISRLASNHSISGSFNIDLSGSSFFTIEGNCVVDYRGTSLFEVVLEFDISGSANFMVEGSFTKTISGGNVFSWSQVGTSIFNCLGAYSSVLEQANSMYYSIGSGTAFQVLGDANINNSSNGSTVLFFTNRGLTDFRRNLDIVNAATSGGFVLSVDGLNAEFKVGGNIEIDGGAASKVQLGVYNNSKMYLAGNLTRLGDFGVLNMSNDATFVYTGGNGQRIIDTNGALTDAFTFSNIAIEIPTGDSMVLEKDFEITGALNLTSGIIKSKEYAPLIINDGARIVGGSPTAYIEGPVKKINLDEGVPFTFPLGHQGVYAPITLETAGGRSAAGGEYTAKYLNCPPPWPGNRAVNIEQLSSEEFWTLDRSEGSTDINVRLHWTDATAQGITNTDDLVVAMFNPDSLQFPMFPSGWTSIGQQDLIGGAGDGVSGSIMNIGTCPPPWGIGLFSFASTSNSNALPVEMKSFNAKIDAEIVEIEFVTANEFQVANFVVEKSVDGVNFSELENISPKGEIGTSQRYSVLDFYPETGSNYYRIRKVDQDGMYAFTDIKVVLFRENSDLMAFPNPLSDHVIIKGKWLQNAEELVIYDANGLLIYQETLTGKEISRYYQLQDLNIYKSGIYILDARSDSNSEQLKLVKP